MTVPITRENVTAVELRREAGRTSDAGAPRRMLAIGLILEGCSRADAARQCGMDRQTLRDWVHRFNADGVAGLSDRPHAGGVPG
jgi:transposase